MKFFQGFKPISTSLSPNTEKDDIRLAWKLLFQPWRWQKGKKIEEIENKFKKYLGIKYAFSFNSGRSALMAILAALKVGDNNDEVLIQAFTCNSVPNAILWMDGKPIYVDIDNGLNLDPDDLEKKITQRSRVVIIQHTFGQPAQIDRILEIAKNHNLKVIEDCAHSLGAEHKNKKIGTFGDAAFFSLGRDKVISSVYGGIAATNDSEISQKLERFQKNCSSPSRFWVFQQLLHPIIFSIALSTYYFLNFGKGLIWLSQKLKLLSFAITKEEKRGKKPHCFPQLLPEALAILALNQFKKLDKFNQHRRKIAEFYDKIIRSQTKVEQKYRVEAKPIYFRYPIFLKNPEKILKELKRNHLLLNDGWRETPVMPPDTNLEKMAYEIGSCPRAEKKAKTILNLPTHINISLKEAKKIIEYITLKDAKKIIEYIKCLV